MTQKKTGISNDSYLAIAPARLAGDFVSDIGARLTTRLFKHVFTMPYDALREQIKQHWVLPRLEQFEERIDQWAAGVETPASREQRMLLPREERAKRIATVMLDLTSDSVGGLVAQVYGQQALDKLFHIGEVSLTDQTKIAFVDRAVQLCCFVGLNVGPGVELNRAGQRHSGRLYQTLLKDLGIEVTQEEAQRTGSDIMNIRATSVAGTVGAILAHHHYANKNPL